MLEVCISNGLFLLSKTLSQLAKLGSEIVLFSHADQLVFSVVNSSQSAFASIHLPTSYFDSLKTDELSETQGIKVQARVLVNALKVSRDNSIIESARIRRETGAETRLVISLFCSHGVVKTHRLSYTVVDPLVFSHDIQANSRWRAPPRLLHDLVGHFPPNLEDVTLVASKDSFVVQTFSTDRTGDLPRRLETNITLDLSEFDEYAVTENLALSMNLKVLRRLFGLAEVLESNLDCYMSGLDEPLLFKCHLGMGESNGYAEMILSTFSEAPLVESSQASPPKSRFSLSGFKRMSTAEPSSNKRVAMEDIQSSTIFNETHPIFNSSQTSEHDEMELPSSPGKTQGAGLVQRLNAMTQTRSPFL